MKKDRYFLVFIFLCVFFVAILVQKYVGHRGVGNLTPDEPLSWDEIYKNLPRTIIVSFISSSTFFLLFKKVRKDVDKNTEIGLERIDNIDKFHSSVQAHECRVCGYWLEEYPWGEDGKQPSYQICPCCGVQFGKEDITPEDIEQYRAVWRKRGYKWFDKAMKPDNWELNEQLKKAPKNCNDNLE